MGYASRDPVPLTQEQIDQVITQAEKTKLENLPNITVGTTPPAEPGIGDLWIDTN